MAAKDFKCDHVENCELYSQFALKGALRIWQIRYCHNETKHLSCERHKRAHEGKKVPLNLLPNGDTLAGTK